MEGGKWWEGMGMNKIKPGEREFPGINIHCPVADRVKKNTWMFVALPKPH